MYNIYPLLIVGAVIGVFAVIFIIAFAMMKDKKESYHKVMLVINEETK